MPFVIVCVSCWTRGGRRHVTEDHVEFTQQIRLSVSFKRLNIHTTSFQVRDVRGMRANVRMRMENLRGVPGEGILQQDADVRREAPGHLGLVNVDAQNPAL